MEINLYSLFKIMKYSNIRLISKNGDTIYQGSFENVPAQLAKTIVTSVNTTYEKRIDIKININTSDFKNVTFSNLEYMEE